MKANEDNPFYDAKVQKILNKLISEEVIASQFYSACIAAVKKDQKNILKEMFDEIAFDEISDHYKNLCEWAIANDYSIPYKFKDYEKFAAQSVVKQFDKLKDNQEATYYVAEALKSEDDAIASYTEAMEYEQLPQELNAILISNYYDEVEHKQNLETLESAVKYQVDLVNW